MNTELTVERRFQGPSGSGQGGYTAGHLAAGLVGTVQADMHKPIPLEAAMRIDTDGDGRRLLISGDTVIMRATKVDAKPHTPRAITLDEARRGRENFTGHERHPVPDCYSCGLTAESLQTWPGPLDDELFATVWTAPDWVCADGVVTVPHLWAVLDCPAGWRAGPDAPSPVAVTATMTARIVEPVPCGQPVAIAAWIDGWRSRRCVAGAAMFAEDGRLLAHQESMWVAIG